MRNVIFAVMAILGASAFAQTGYGHHGGWGINDYGFGGLLMWILLAVLIVVVVYLTFRQHGTGRSDTPRETPLEILKRRYAKGEISEEEYERMRDKLTKGS